jgi:hypothetical protein
MISEKQAETSLTTAWARERREFPSSLQLPGQTDINSL